MRNTKQNECGEYKKSNTSKICSLFYMLRWLKIFCPGVIDSYYQLLIYAEHVDADKTHRDFKTRFHQLIGSALKVTKFWSQFIVSGPV